MNLLMILGMLACSDKMSDEDTGEVDTGDTNDTAEDTADTDTSDTDTDTDTDTGDTMDTGGWIGRIIGVLRLQAKYRRA